MTSKPSTKIPEISNEMIDICQFLVLFWYTVHVVLLACLCHSLVQTAPPPYQKSQERGGWKNCWRVSLGIFSSWGVANVTTVTLNYILIIVLLFALNVGVSPCFHCSVLGPVYRMYTSCFHNTVVSSCYRLHTFCLHHASVNSCFSLNMWF